ncbi:hypothetical protein ALT_8028 [Aspergillus lentulus]|uniref:Uncharacterized protein n=1 Tax=Aspergillus lentulus TaxID=293939 RepID=A0AAN4PPQ6_ASPLE|nr:hypothetical protein ALT_8028 [Aspergillus lentulus]
MGYFNSSDESSTSPFVTPGPDDDEFTTSGKNSPHDLGIAGDDTGNPPAPAEEAAEMPLPDHRAAKEALHRADLANKPCTLTLAQTRAVLDCLRRESQASASGSLTSTKGSTARLEFLVHLGDYAGRLWKCLRKASIALKDELPDRVGAFNERLIVEGKYGRGAYADTLLACVNYLRQHGMDVDEETARLAIQIYTERNEACHAEVGNPNIAGNSRALAEAIDRDIEMLSQVLPEDQVPNRKYLERLMHFYRDSASWLAEKDHDRLEDHRESRTPRLPPPEDSSIGPTRHGNESPDNIRSVSPRKRTVSGSSKAHQPSTSSEGLHAFDGILEDIAVLRSRGGDKAIQAVQEARKLLQAAMEVTYQDEKAAAMDVPQQKKRRY